MIQDCDALADKTIIPFPKRIEDIIGLYQDNDTPEWQGRKFDILVWQDRYGGTDEVTPIDGFFGHRLNLYLAQRGRVQLHLALDKTIGTLLTYKGFIATPRPGIFLDFLPTTTVPELYYGFAYSLLASMSAFGLGSITLPEIRGYYSIVRSVDGFVLVDRRKLLHRYTSNSTTQWHLQVNRLYYWMVQKGYEIPFVEESLLESFYNIRLKFHYDSIAKTSMDGLYGKEYYFDLLPDVIGHLKSGVEIFKPILSKFEAGKFDRRIVELQELVDTIQVLAE